MQLIQRIFVRKKCAKVLLEGKKKKSIISIPRFPRILQDCLKIIVLSSLTCSQNLAKICIPRFPRILQDSLKIFYFPLRLVAKNWLMPPGGLLPVMPTIIHHKTKFKKHNHVLYTLSLRGRAKKFFCLKWWRKREREREREKLCKKKWIMCLIRQKSKSLKASKVQNSQLSSPYLTCTH